MGLLKLKINFLADSKQKVLCRSEKTVKIQAGSISSIILNLITRLKYFLHKGGFYEVLMETMRGRLQFIFSGKFLLTTPLKRKKMRD